MPFTHFDIQVGDSADPEAVEDADRFTADLNANGIICERKADPFAVYIHAEFADETQAREAARTAKKRTGMFVTLLDPETDEEEDAR